MKAYWFYKNGYPEDYVVWAATDLFDLLQKIAIEENRSEEHVMNNYFYGELQLVFDPSTGKYFKVILEEQ